MRIGVNRLRTKFLALVLLLCCVFSFALAEGTAQTMQTVETLYTAISREYTLPVYAGEEIGRMLPMARYLGFDFVITADDKVKILEINSLTSLDSLQLDMPLLKTPNGKKFFDNVG